ncbi:MULTISPECIES: hypothetical protein [Sphingobacterium]|uniref:hypothetical protein n=1 Tax=Sphingobacterium TaxID=28453 RepID=UPI001047BAE3|nr:MULTISPECIES: hypothetical protein [Sphingobacterium]MCW2260335.1 hypothetical protein [Sphingobacterium kitahiroshimense]TCR05408.1 hypothetical protein EDF67_11030 [Sphingobacterium sp. JUb78]
MAKGYAFSQRSYPIKTQGLSNAWQYHPIMPIGKWLAKFRRTKGAVKLHTVLEYDGCLPVFIQIADGKVYDSQCAGSYSFTKGSVVVVD